MSSRYKRMPRTYCTYHGQSVWHDRRGLPSLLFGLFVMSHPVRLRKRRSATTGRHLSTMYGRHTSQSSHVKHQPLMSPTHIVVISLQLPLKAITGPVVTPSHRLSEISVSAAAGTTVISCSCPDSFESQLGGTALNWDPTWLTTKDGNRITLCDSHPRKHLHR